METGLRAKGWGSTMLRATERNMARTWVAEGIVADVVFVWLVGWTVESSFCKCLIVGSMKLRCGLFERVNGVFDRYLSCMSMW
jgi:hypothetical protein